MWGAWQFVLLSACTFATPIQADEAVDGALSVDAAAAVERVDGAIALWRFAEPSGTELVDSAGSVPLRIAPGAAELADGGLTLTARVAIESAPSPPINKAVRQANAVTFEAWVTPADAAQGASDYSVVAAITQNFKARNVSLEQRGGRWAARVRTQVAGKGGEPPIVSEQAVEAGRAVHLVVTADAAGRTLYVDGHAAESVPSGAGELTWDASYRVRVGDERSSDHHWLGTIWLLATYDRALSADEVRANFAAGPRCANC